MQNVEHVNPPFIEEENVNDMNIVKNKSEEKQTKQIDNMINND